MEDKNFWLEESKKQRIRAEEAEEKCILLEELNALKDCTIESLNSKMSSNELLSYHKDRKIARLERLNAAYEEKLFALEHGVMQLRDYNHKRTLEIDKKIAVLREPPVEDVK